MASKPEVLDTLELMRNKYKIKRMNHDQELKQLKQDYYFVLEQYAKSGLFTPLEESTLHTDMWVIR